MRLSYIVEMYGNDGRNEEEVWWTWWLKTANGCVIAEGELYDNRTVCRNVIEKLQESFTFKFKEFKPGRLPIRSEREKSGQ